MVNDVSRRIYSAFTYQSNIAADIVQQRDLKLYASFLSFFNVPPINSTYYRIIITILIPITR